MNRKEKCHILRSQGKSYNFISHETGIAKSTLSYWFRHEPSLNSVYEANKERNRTESRERLLAYLKLRNQKLREKEFATILEAQKDFQKYQKHPLFMAGLMLYAGEGDKANRNQIKLSNSDPQLCLIFVRFMYKYFPYLAQNKMKLWILGYEDHNKAIIEAFWLKTLSFEAKDLYKTQIIKGRHKTRRLPYGVGNVTIPNRLAKVKLLEFIRLSIKVLSK